jgi:hypothetical protein
MTDVYEASKIKRVRRTRAEMDEYRGAIRELVEVNQPCSCRQVYYLGIGRYWEKDTGGSRNIYNDVVRNLGLMRESGEIPWSWITDATRYCRIPTMYDSTDEALERTAEFYRRDLWSSQPWRVEVWAESDSISGVIDPVTRALGVGLFSCRGQASKTFAQSSAEAYRHIGKPVKIFYVGDHDPSGIAISRSLNERLERYNAEAVPIFFERLAVTAADVLGSSLTSHTVNRADNNYRRFAEYCRGSALDPGEAIEVEAIPPPVLRSRLNDAVYEMVHDADSWNATLAAEESERGILLAIATGGCGRPDGNQAHRRGSRPRSRRPHAGRVGGPAGAGRVRQRRHPPDLAGHGSAEPPDPLAARQHHQGVAPAGSPRARGPVADRADEHRQAGLRPPRTADQLPDSTATKPGPPSDLHGLEARTTVRPSTGRSPDHGPRKPGPRSADARTTVRAFSS